MAMTIEQACELCDCVVGYFNMNMTDQQKELWVDLFMERGDYELTMKKIKTRATSDNPFKPMISEIIEKPLVNHNAEFFDREEDKQNKALRKDKDFMAERRRKAEEYQRMAENGELTIHDL